jgi:hypothetical protein
MPGGGQRLGSDPPALATHCADTCISTLSLCNANFTEVSLGNATSGGGEAGAWTALTPACS